MGKDPKTDLGGREKQNEKGVNEFLAMTGARPFQQAWKTPSSAHPLAVQPDVLPLKQLSWVAQLPIWEEI